MKFVNSSLLAVLGPTGSGKSDLALALARAFDGEIVNFDSVQVHRGLDIGSAKVPPLERNDVRHHLLDVISPDEELTAGAYVRLARATLDEIRAAGRIPVLVGGTGFYLRSLLDGLSPGPIRNPILRERLEAVRIRRPAALYRLLRRRDPLAAARIHPNDLQKLIRAIEISGAPPLAPRPRLEGFRVCKIGLNPPRAELCQRIDRRSQNMFRTGLLQEVESLIAAGASPDSKALQSLGYKQAMAVLRGQMDVSSAIQEVQTKTRQYAKRQMTWFRKEEAVSWLAGFGDDPAIQEQAARLATEFLA